MRHRFIREGFREEITLKLEAGEEVDFGGELVGKEELRRSTSAKVWSAADPEGLVQKNRNCLSGP